MNKNIAIKVQNLTKTYKLYNNPMDRLKESLHPFRKKYHKDFYALNNVSFEVNKGEMVGIIGRNGSGKSTLLKILTGVVTPTGGHYQVGGKISAILELGAGFNPEMTGVENIYLNTSINGLNKQETDKIVDEIIEFSELGEFIHQPLKTYSSGMNARLAFGVAINIDPDILIIDEALSVGDAAFSRKCFAKMEEIRAKGTTILFVSHDTGLIKVFCSSIIWLDKGKIIQIGDTKTICENYLEFMHNGNLNNGEKKVITETKLSNQKKAQSKKDIRSDIINSSNLRNDIQIFEFNPQESSFGEGGCQIVAASLINTNGQTLSWMIGGEEVTLKIEIIVKKDLFSPIVGFLINDKLGQILWGDNTFISYKNDPLRCKKNEKLIVEFGFLMPRLAKGEYTITVAVAEGTQNNHTQHHWIHNAIKFNSISTGVTGLIGLAMNKINLEKG